MATPFSRTLRSLQADSHQGALVLFAIALPLCLGWLFWFFAADVTLYETGQFFAAAEQGTVMALMPAKTANSLRPGQEAFIHLQERLPNGTTTVNAIVTDLDYRAQSPQVLVELLLSQNDIEIDPQKVTGRIEIEIGRQSPAEMAIEFIGDYLNTPMEQEAEGN